MTRENLIDVFTDTTNRVESGEYNSDIYSELRDINDIKKPLIRSSDSGNILVQNDDCINVANQFSKLGKTCMLNMASYKKPGGGVKSGSMAQEEELARRSNLMWGLPIEYYPLSMNEYIYTRDVTFFKDKNYNIINEFNCDVITIASVNLNGLDKPRNYEELMRNKIETMLYYPYQNGCKNLVLSAFGCGVFKNDPYFVAGLFDELLDSYSRFYSNTSFAILNDRNSVGSNYQIFKEILD